MKNRNWILQKKQNPEPDDIFIEKILRQDALLNGGIFKLSQEPLSEGPEFLPVGDIPFVEKWLKKYHKKPMKSIEVPEILRTEKYLVRSYIFMDRDKLPSYEISDRKYFVKNVNRLKTFNSAMYDGYIPNPSTLEPGTYLVTDWLDIRSEFRIFVHLDQILGVQRYLGSPLIFPDSEKVSKMVADYQKDSRRPEAYTMDVAVICKPSQEADTVILEVHPFVSCGLYGFYDKEIPDMLEAGLKYYIET